ncbi:MAG: phosphoribosylglycinamide formyltransferase, partial [Clostridia bacterium]|nr:phosphoribosylglycinamide formyltransferase [Clostridia bacterium]
DSMYFKEIPDFELIAVISSEREAYAMKRALNAGVPAFVVDPELFPNSTSHSMAVANKLKDMDIDLVILAGYEQPLGVIPYQFKNRIIGTYPALCPAFEETEGDVQRAVLERGVKVTGATSYFADGDGRVGGIISQRAVEVKENDTPETLSRRVLEEAEWKLLSQAVSLYCGNKLKIHGNRVIIEK